MDAKKHDDFFQKWAVESKKKFIDTVDGDAFVQNK